MDDHPLHHTETDITRTLERLPHGPGVYVFSDIAGIPIYVGKASSLSRRVRQYFISGDALGEKTAHIVRHTVGIRIIQTLSEFEAILLEASLIRQYQPQYNAIAKDDKSPLYIKIEKRVPLPRISFVRKTAFPDKRTDSYSIFGPFRSGRIARQIMRTVRKIVPYCTQKERSGTPCFYTHIGLCNPCPSVIVRIADAKTRRTEEHRYVRNIRRIVRLLKGQSDAVRRELEKDMEQAAKGGMYEHAASIRDQLTALGEIAVHRYDPMVFAAHDEFAANETDDALASIRTMLLQWYPDFMLPVRIECYDISNLFGTYAVGSLVVATDGRIDTSQYRRFRIRSETVPNDVGMMKEMVTRRIRHTEWQNPTLLVVDGGKGQVRAIRELISASRLSGVPVIGLAKRFEEIVIPHGTSYTTIRLQLTDPGLRLLMRLRDEAHRFAIRYHSDTKHRQIPVR